MRTSNFIGLWNRQGEEREKLRLYSCFKVKAGDTMLLYIIQLNYKGFFISILVLLPVAPVVYVLYIWKHRSNKIFLNGFL